MWRGGWWTGGRATTTDVRLLIECRPEDDRRPDDWARAHDAAGLRHKTGFGINEALDLCGAAWAGCASVTPMLHATAPGTAATSNHMGTTENRPAGQSEETEL